MNGDEFFIYGVPLLSFGVTVFLSHWLGKMRNGAALAVLGLIWAGFTAGMFFGMEQANGWDGLWYILALMFVSAPSGAGLGLGSLIGWIRSERQLA